MDRIDEEDSQKKKVLGYGYLYSPQLNHQTPDLHSR